MQPSPSGPDAHTPCVGWWRKNTVTTVKTPDWEKGYTAAHSQVPLGRLCKSSCAYWRKLPGAAHLAGPALFREELHTQCPPWRSQAPLVTCLLHNSVTFR